MSNLRSLSCPTCGAPLTVAGNATEIKCEFCGNVAVVTPELRMNSMPAGQASPVVNLMVGNVSSRQPAASSSGCGFLVPFILIFVVVGAIITGGILLITNQAASQFSSVFSTVAQIAPTGTPAVSVVTTFGGEGTGAGLFTDPDEFAVDGKGFVYVSDRTTGLIQRFDAHGHYLSQWQADPQAKYGPTCLTADHAGNVFACGNAGLLKFDGATGKLLATFVGNKTKSPTDFFRSSAAALLDGSVLVYESSNDQLIKLSPSGKVLYRTDKISSHLPADNTTFNVQITVDGLGNSFVLETSTSYVLEYKPDGTYVNRFGGKGNGSDQFNDVLTIAVDNQSRIYAIDMDVIKLFDRDGHFLTSYPLPPDANRVTPLGMGLDDPGNLYVLGSDKKIYKLQFAANR